jgi:chorismate dehydratase
MSRLRFGVLSYINCLPATLALEQGEVGAGELDLWKGTPAELNRAIRNGDLDVSVISAAEYLENRELYHRLKDFSLWCDGPVRSVCLFSRLHRNELDSAVRLSVTPESATSVALVRILAKQSIITPFTTLQQVQGEIESRQSQGVLLIGDTALDPPAWTGALKSHDLGAWWKDVTGLPMTYAVWVARRDLDPEKLNQARDILARSCQWGERNKETVLKEARGRSGLGMEHLESYLGGIKFQVTEDSVAGYRRFREEFTKDLARDHKQIAPVGAGE